jgi:hypothetical protein
VWNLTRMETDGRGSRDGRMELGMETDGEGALIPIVLSNTKELHF